MYYDISISFGKNTVKDLHIRTHMYRTTDYLDLAIDTQCLEPCLRPWNIRRCQSAVEEMDSSSGSSEIQNKKPSVRFLLGPGQDQEVDTVDCPPTLSTPATLTR